MIFARAAFALLAALPPTAAPTLPPLPAASAALPTYAPAPEPAPAATAAPERKLSGAMTRYAWFAGRWACRTAKVGASGDPAPGRLWVVVDPKINALDQSFEMAGPGGKPYRSDDTLLYDAKLHAYVRRTIDVNGAQVMLVGRTPYQRVMDFIGLVGVQGKLYRMRASVAVDAAQSQITTATAFWHADTKTWVVQTTGACTKI